MEIFHLAKEPNLHTTVEPVPMACVQAGIAAGIGPCHCIAPILRACLEWDLNPRLRSKNKKRLALSYLERCCLPLHWLHPPLTTISNVTLL